MKILSTKSIFNQKVLEILFICEFMTELGFHVQPHFMFMFMFHVQPHFMFMFHVHVSCSTTFYKHFRKVSPNFVEHFIMLKGVFAKNERGYRLNAIKKRF